MPTFHVCLASENIAASLTPIIDTSIDSDYLVVITKTAYLKEAELLLSVARTRGYKGEIARLPETRKTSNIKLFLETLFSKLQKQSQDIWLNATGGDRYVALAAFEVARDFELPVYVVEPDHDSLFWLFPEDKPSTPIQDKLKLHEYFTLLNFQIEHRALSEGIIIGKRELGAQWTSDVDYYSAGLKILNFYAARARSSLSVTLDKNIDGNPALYDIFHSLASLNLISLNGNKLTFTSEGARFFCNGGWLEEYCFSIVRGLTKDIRSIQDHSHSVEVKRKIGGKEVKNELDVVALVNNKLHIVECKTGAIKAEKSNHILYRLNSLTDMLDSVNGRAALVSLLEIPYSVSARAAELNITVIGPAHLANLKRHLYNWLSTA